MLPEDMNNCSKSDCTTAASMKEETTISNAICEAKVEEEVVKEVIAVENQETAEISVKLFEATNDAVDKITLIENGDDENAINVEDEVQAVKEIVEELKDHVGEVPASSSETSNEEKNISSELKHDNHQDAVNSEEEVVKEVVEELKNAVVDDAGSFEDIVNQIKNDDDPTEKVADSLSLLKINENEETDSDGTPADVQNGTKNEEQENAEDDEDFSGDNVIGRFMTCFRAPYEKQQAEFYADPEYTNEKILVLLTENSDNMTKDQQSLLEHFQRCLLRREIRRDTLAKKALEAIHRIQEERKSNIKELERQYEARIAKIENQFWNLSTELMEQYNEIDASGDENDD